MGSDACSGAPGWANPRVVGHGRRPGPELERRTTAAACRGCGSLRARHRPQPPRVCGFALRAMFRLSPARPDPCVRPCPAMSKPRPSARPGSSPAHSARRRTLVLGLGATGLALSQPGAWALEPALPPLPAFQETGFADSPLVGRIVGADGLALQPAQLLAQCAAASICMLGEQHDHPDHHALQTWVIQALAARGQLAAVALEMVDAGRRVDGPAHAASGQAGPPQVSSTPAGGGSASRPGGHAQGHAGPPQVSLTPSGGGSASRPWGRPKAKPSRKPRPATPV